MTTVYAHLVGERLQHKVQSSVNDSTYIQVQKLIGKN